MPAGASIINSFFMRPYLLILIIFLIFILLFGIAFTTIYYHYLLEAKETIVSNNSLVNLLSIIMYENRKATIGVIESYRNCPVLINAYKSRDYDTATKRLTSMKDNNPEIDEAFITNNDGTLKIIYPASKGILGKNLSHTGWFKEVSKEGKSYTSGIIRSIVDEKDFAITACTPIFDEKREIIGILGTSRRTVSLGKIPDQAILYPDRKITLIDQKGQIIYSNRFSYEKEIIKYPDLPFLKKVMQRERGSIEMKDSFENNRKKYITFAPIKESGWSIIVERGKREIIKSQAGHFIQIGTIFFLLFFIISLSLVYIRKEIVSRQMFELKQTQDSLRMSENRYITLFDDSPISLWEQDFSAVKTHIDNLRKSGINDFKAYFETHSEDVKRLASMVKVVEANKSTLELYKADSKEDFLGSLTSIFNEESYDVFKEELIAITEGKIRFESENINKKLTGETIHIFLSWSVAPGHEESYSKIIVSIADITQRKKMEKEIIKARKLESLGVLAGGIAHDFNNILTAIMGNVSLAKIYTKPEDKIFEKLTNAEKACLRAKDLAQQFVSLSRGDAPIKKITSITEVLKNSVNFALAGSRIRSEFSIPDDLWTVEIDEGQIRQAVNNLALNAREAMPEGGAINIKAENVTLSSDSSIPLKEGRYIKISIKDRGTGIPPGHLSKIFDPYFTTKSKGSGLGLTTSYSIVTKHDGCITVESELGKGTTFFIYLPASDREIIPAKESVASPMRGKGRILIMDDEEAIRDLATEMLNHLGYKADVSKDGDEAIKLYREALISGQPFDAVIMDLTIPAGMGGKEAITKLLEIDPHIKAIVSSGYSNDPIMSDYTKYGFKGVIAKPYKLQEMSEVLNNIITRK